jgi:hypothetical protein
MKYRYERIGYVGENSVSSDRCVNPALQIRGKCVTFFYRHFTLQVSVCFLPSFFEAASFIQTKKLGFDILIEETQ